MKTIIRHYVIDTFSLWLVASIASGILFTNGINTLLIAGVGLTIASLFAKPVINMLLLPINLVTYGLFGWVSSAVVLYLVTLVVRDFQITHFRFLGFTSKWFDLPPIYFEGTVAFICFGFILSFITSFLHWLHK